MFFSLQARDLSLPSLFRCKDNVAQSLVRPLDMSIWLILITYVIKPNAHMAISLITYNDHVNKDRFVLQ